MFVFLFESVARSDYSSVAACLDCGLCNPPPPPLLIALRLCVLSHFCNISRMFDWTRRVNEIDRCPLQCAVAAGNRLIVTMLLHDGFPSHGTACDARHLVRYHTDSPTAPLYTAARNGDMHIVDLLLSHGASVAASSSSGTALHAAAKGGHGCVIARLLEAGAAVDAVDGRCARVFQARHLVDVNVTRSSQRTPLHVACNAATVSLLIAAGADVNARNCKYVEPPRHRWYNRCMSPASAHHSQSILNTPSSCIHVKLQHHHASPSASRLHCTAPSKASGNKPPPHWFKHQQT